MPNILKHASLFKVKPYQFPEAEELAVEKPEPQAPAPAPVEEEREEPLRKEEADSALSYAQVQADQILLTAERQAEEILESARQEARKEADALCEKARQEGWEAGRAEGMRQGAAEAAEENRRMFEERVEALTAEVDRFLEQAAAQLDRQLDDNVEELRDLAVAVAEKVISVSLKSSSEVIGRMIQTAIDKRKRREWVRIHIAECDAKHMARLTPALTAALTSLSGQVRIIPMAEDEPGTCIIEMPDEIIDASAATQLDNIRTMLAETPADETEHPFGGGSADHVPPHDPPSL